MQIVIMDHDAFGDDFMGQADLDLREIIKKKNEWGVNNWYMLKDIKGHGKRKQPVSGSIYVQCQYVEEGTPADQVQAPPVTDLPTPQTLVTIFKGNLKTKVYIYIYINSLYVQMEYVQQRIIILQMVMLSCL